MSTYHPITLSSATILELNETHRVRSAGRDEDGSWLFVLEEKSREDGYAYKRRIRAKYKGEVS